MSQLPLGWATVRLQEVSRVVRGITFPASEKQAAESESNVCCLRTSNIQKEVDWSDVYFVDQSFVKREDQIVQTGDILMSMANSYELVGKVAIAKHVPYKTAFGAFLSAVRPTPAVDGKYLFHLLRTSLVQSELRQGSSQTTNIANISIGTLSDIEVALAPLAEQKRIADKLDAVLARVDACRDRLDRIPTILKRFRQSVLAAATSGQLTADWRKTQQEKGTSGKGEDVLVADAKSKAKWLASNPEFKKKKSSLNAEMAHEYAFELPEGWVFNTWGIITEWITYGFTRPMPSVEMGRRLVTAKDVQYFSLNTSSAGFTTEAAFDSLNDKDKPVRGDLLITKDGTIGRAALVRTDEPFCINQSVAVCWLRSTTMNKDYLEIVSNSDFTQRFVKDMAQGMAIQHLSITDFAKCPVPVPSHAEQDEIVRRVEILFAFADRLEARVAAARESADRLTPALLAKAFRGELVPQDPNDEPAAELLKHLAASNNGEDQPKRGRKRA